MPKSKHRKGRKPYRGKLVGDAYSIPDPLALFRLIGRGALDTHEEEAACQLLLQTMGEADSATEQFFAMSGLLWPPTSNDDIRRLARAVIDSEGDSSADTGRDQQTDGRPERPQAGVRAGNGDDGG